MLEEELRLTAYQLQRLRETLWYWTGLIPPDGWLVRLLDPLPELHTGFTTYGLNREIRENLMTAAARKLIQRPWPRYLDPPEPKRGFFSDFEVAAHRSDIPFEAEKALGPVSPAGELKVRSKPGGAKGVALLSMEGALAESNTEGWAAVLDDLVGEGHSKIILDMSGLKGVDLAAFDFLIYRATALESAGGALAAFEVPPTLARALGRAGLGVPLRVYSREAEAVRDLK